MCDAFEVLLDHGASDAVTARLAHGFDSITLVSTLYQDVSKAHEICAANIRDSIQRFKLNLSDQENDPSFEAQRALFLESMTYLGVVAKVQEQMANAFSKKICQPLEDLKAQYSQVKLDICGPGNRTGESAKLKTRAMAKIRIADEEIVLAQNSLEQLKRRFGEEIKPALLQKAEERLTRADSMKRQAELELRDLDTSSEVGRPPPAESQSRGLTKDTLRALEKAETSRVLRTLDCVRLAVRLYFTYLETIASPLAVLSSACDAYSPQYDINLWLSMATGNRISESRCAIKDDRKFALDERNLNWLKGGGPDQGGGIAPETARLRAELARKDVEIEVLNNELQKISNQDFLKGGPPAKGSEPSDTAAGAVSPPKTKQLEFAIPESPSEGEEESPPAKAKQNQPPQSSGVNHFFQRVATAITGRPTARESEYDAESGWEINDSSENPQNWGDDDDFKLSDYIPIIKERLTIDWPPNVRFLDKVIEIQRRLEEYYWALRNINVDELARVDPWDSPDHAKPFDFEYGFSAYLCKFPRYTFYTSFSTVHVHYALEWGSRMMPTSEWNLFSYESLILGEHIAQRICQLRELATLPERDVSQIGQTLQTTAGTNPMANRRMGKSRISVVESQMNSMTTGNPLNDSTSAAADLTTVSGDVQTQAFQIMMYNSESAKNLMRQWRVRLGLTAKENLFLISLLVPSTESGNISHNPLDVRYRVHCLSLTWICKAEIMQDIECQGGSNHLTKMYKSFIFRNLHFVRISILAKLQRLASFLPQLAGVSRWLSSWLFAQDWSRAVQSCIPLPDERDNDFVHDNLAKLINCFKLMCVILADLLNSYFADEWGISHYADVDMPVELIAYETKRQLSSARALHESSVGGNMTMEGSCGTPGVGFGYRNPESFLRLSALMSCVESLDISIRAELASEEREQSYKDNVSPNVSEAMTEDNPQALGGEEFNDLQHFDIFQAQTAYKLDHYWQYELPVQHLILCQAAELITDSQKPNKLSPDCVSIIQAVIILSHLLQHGMDPSTTSSELRISNVTTTLDTIRLYLVHGIWRELLRSASAPQLARPPSDDLIFNIEDDSDTKPVERRPSQQSSASADADADLTVLPRNLLFSVESLSMMKTLSSDFVTWLLSIAAPANLSEDISISETVTVRLLNCSLHNMFDALEMPRGKFRKTSQTAAPGATKAIGEVRRHFDHTDPDFGVINYSTLDDVAHKPSFFHELSSIRECPEGASLILPCRVERMVNELCLRRAATDSFRSQLYRCLCDYRKYFDTQSLPLGIILWQQVNDLLVLTPAVANPKPLDVAQLQSLVALPLLLNGPVALHDLFRHFISRSISAVFDRIFAAALHTLHEPSDSESWFLTKLSEIDEEEADQKVEIEKAWSQVIGKFSVASRKMISELQTEIVHYSEIWAPILPGNQHAMISLYTIEDKFRVLLDDLRNSPFWPEDTLPPSSSGITSALNQFDKLVHEVRRGSRYENLLADSESLSAPFSASIASALSKRLKTIEPLLTRCVMDDWKPVDPPRNLYSTGAVDFFQFLYHILSAVWEYEASTEWVMPILLQFMLRVSRQYGEKIKSTVAEPRLTYMEKYTDQIIGNLTNPLPRVDISLIGQLMGKHKKKGLKGFFGFGGGGKKKAAQVDLANQLRDMNFNEPEYDEGQYGGPMSGSQMIGANTEHGGPAAEGDEGGDIGPSNDLNPAEISDDLKELAARIGPPLALGLHALGTALDPTGTSQNSLKTWLTRLHNLHYFYGEIGNLSMRILQCATQASSSAQQSASEPSEIMLALEKAGGRKVTTAIAQDKEDDARIQVWQAQLVETVSQCRTVVNQKAVDVCKLCALRIVYFDLADDLFEDVYSPTIGSGHTLSNLVTALDNTVLKFVNATPALYQECLLRDILMQLIKGWLVLVTELGFMGYCFSADDIDVLDNDMQSLRNLLKRYQVREEIDVAGETRNIFSLISEYISFLGSQPNTLAQLGGNYDKKKPEPPAEKSGAGGLVAGLGVQPNLSPTVDDDPEVKNMFAGLGTASPAFKAEEIVGKKKKKSVFKGAMKLLKMK